MPDMRIWQYIHMRDNLEKLLKSCLTLRCKAIEESSKTAELTFENGTFKGKIEAYEQVIDAIRYILRG